MTILLSALFSATAVTALLTLMQAARKLGVAMPALHGQLATGIAPMVIRTSIRATGAISGTVAAHPHDCPEGATIYRPDFARAARDWHGSLAA